MAIGRNYGQMSCGEPDIATFDRTMDLYETGWRYAQQVLDGVTVTG